MAKIQGHLLKHRDSIEATINNAKEMLEVEVLIKDMSINEWLRRLNLHQYAYKFKTIGKV